MRWSWKKKSNTGVNNKRRKDCKPSKQRSIDKIDGIVSAIMACGLAAVQPEEKEFAGDIMWL